MQCYTSLQTMALPFPFIIVSDTLPTMLFKKYQLAINTDNYIHMHTHIQTQKINYFNEFILG